MEKKIQQLADYLLGTCKTVGEGMAASGIDGLDDSNAQTKLLQADIELCVNCYWWHEVHELQHNEDEGGGICEQCADELGIDWD